MKQTGTELLNAIQYNINIKRTDFFNWIINFFTQNIMFSL